MKKLLCATVLACAAAAVLWEEDVYSHNPISTTVLFNREIATVFNAKCVQCHSDDGMAMSLRTHPQARPWAIAIKEEILARRMPPWPAERGYGSFANDGGLSPREMEFLISWIDGGVPQGEGTPPEYLDHSAHWMMGTPDGVYTASPDRAGNRPSGITRFIVEPGFRDDTLIRGFDLKMPDKRAARAAFLSVAGTDQYIGGWTPWSTSTEFPAETAFRLPAGARIAVDVLHGPSTEVVQPPSMGLYVAKTATHVLDVSQVTGQAPAAERRIRVRQPLSAARTIVGLRVEMSPGGKSIEVNARRPDGVFEPLVWIKDFRQDWQVPFVLKTPVALPAGSVIQATSYFDESAPGTRRATVHVVGYGSSPAPAVAQAVPAHVR